MSLTDRTNETIPLSQHKPMTWGGSSFLGEVIMAGSCPASLDVDADSDSSLTPSCWVAIALTDSEHDSDTIKLTYEEVGLLYDRLGRILGKVTE